MKKGILVVLLSAIVGGVTAYAVVKSADTSEKMTATEYPCEAATIPAPFRSWLVYMPISEEGATRPIIPLDFVLSPLPSWLGCQLKYFKASMTRSLLSCLTPAEPLSTLDTVAMDTPARCAMSWIEAIRFPPENVYRLIIAHMKDIASFF